MAIRFRCHSCSGLMSISSRKAGMLVACPKCGEQTLVPLEDIFQPVPEPVEPEALPANPVDPVTQPVAAQPPVHSNAVEFEPSFEPDDDESSHVSGDVRPNEPVDHELKDGGTEDDDAPALQLRRRPSGDDDMDLTPMVDVTFQLLIFFMVTASFALQKSIEVPTPDPDKKGAAQQLQILEDLEGSSIRIQIDASNTILIDDEPLADPTRLVDALKDKMRKEQKTEALISAHATSLHRWVIAVIDACNSVGMQKIRLVSRQGKSE